MLLLSILGICGGLLAGWTQRETESDIYKLWISAFHKLLRLLCVCVCVLIPCVVCCLSKTPARVFTTSVIL